LIVAMEPTGTYGDSLRARLTAAGLEVRRVGSKASHDYAEVFDGVPSQHDGKDAAVVAELAAFGKSRPWPYQPPRELEADLAYWVDWLDAQQRIQVLWLGRLEGLLARHWPEATRLLELNSVTLLKTLAHYGGPTKLAADPAAAERLAGWLFFAAMRSMQTPPARGWYEGKKAKDKDRGKGALTAVMRKLALALWNVGARGERFEDWRLFPGRSTARRAAQSRRCVL
jgi:transposase